MNRQILNRLLSPFVLMPSFYVVGVQKGGTTSLFDYLCQHPDILSPAVKEIFFYGLYYDRGREWYRSFFPLAIRQKYITGEASTDSLTSIDAPMRLFKDCPTAKIIMVLRNPVERAISHYYHNVRKQREIRPIEEALFADLDRSEENLHHFGYLRSSEYAEHLKAWLEHFPREQILVQRSEDLFADPEKVTQTCFKFLGKPEVKQIHYRAQNTGTNKLDIPPSLSARLHTHFAPHNRRLEELLGCNSWTSTWS